MPQEIENNQLLHIVFGGELRDVNSTAYRDQSQLNFVGAITN